MIDIFYDWIFNTLPCPDPRCALSEHGKWGHASAWKDQEDCTGGITYTGWNDCGTGWIGVWP